MSKLEILSGPLIPTDPHLSGTAHCLDCKHKWVAVAPIDTVWLECPACTLVRGRFTNQIERFGSHWHCKCGNDLFHLQENQFYCPNCGKTQSF